MGEESGYLTPVMATPGRRGLAVREAAGRVPRTAAGIVASEVGEVVPGAGARRRTEPGGSTSVHAEPVPDPYWPSHARAVAAVWE